MNLSAGDKMRFSVALLKNMDMYDDHLTVMVEVVKIQQQEGWKTVVLKRCDQQLPCACGCGKLVDGGMMEAAHPEDYRDERG